MVGTVGIATLVVCRILLGAGEGPAFSVAVHALYKWFPDEQRTLPTAVLTQGAAFGVIVALPALNWIIVHYSWHLAFFALGVVGLLWAVVWLLLGREGPIAAPVVPAAGGAGRDHVPYPQLLLNPTFIGCCLAGFGASWALTLGLTWFTPFIITGLGYSQQNAGWISALPWMMGAVVVLATGSISQTLLARGASPRTARGVLGSAPPRSWRIDHSHRTARRRSGVAGRVASNWRRSRRINLCRLSADHQWDHADGTTRRNDLDLRCHPIVRRHSCARRDRKRDRGGGDLIGGLLHRLHNYRVGTAVWRIGRTPLAPAHLTEGGARPTPPEIMTTKALSI